MLDGTSKQVQITAITDGILQGPDTQNPTLDDLQRIEPAASAAAAAPRGIRPQSSSCIMAACSRKSCGCKMRS
jgi:hypothetical protein